MTFVSTSFYFPKENKKLLISHTDTFCEDRWPIKNYRQPTVGGLRQINYCRLCPGDPASLGTPDEKVGSRFLFSTHRSPLNVEHIGGEVG
jgi:hypothetical protein